MNFSDWQKMINQAKQLGVFAFLIAGGEPFLMKDLLELIVSNKDRVFAIFTNGT
jgi:molybdenum cofactor biosynthesis enzyme MoaA